MKTMISNIAVCLGWTTLMTIGFTVDSSRLLSLVGDPDVDLLKQVVGLAFGVLCFTPSNVALVSVLSCYIGAELADVEADHSKKSLARQWRLSIARGFLVFALTFFVGSWVDRNMLLQADQQDYFGLVSACAFLGLGVGYEPERIGQLLKRSQTND
jgi:hypothetical protein